MADQTIKNLNRLEKAIGDDFIAEIQIAARQEEARQKRRDELTSALIVDKSEEAENRIEQIKHDLLRRNQNALEDATIRLTSEHGLDLLNHRLKSTQSRLNDLTRERTRLLSLAEKIKRKATRSANTKVGILSIIFPLIFGYFLWKYGWNKLEPITFMGTLIVAAIGFFCFIFLKVEFSYTGIRDAIEKKETERLQKEFSLDPVSIKESNEMISSAELEIQELKRLLAIENEAASYY
ncbi:hypothetical protein [Hymenobacter sp. BT491]|uniref:hypothetical protein n=1 Tax=Hymenobacter sp. BT491 TaxID=2766779 RepID=UPI0016539052|nr:hypothetical protein [Hymenobacter sp. BT491]MBC6991927.1 hypothetical protein [Hymenobacter sp. BT491]